ncbi:UPF0434 protein Mmar10_2939-like [Ostrea edulis]|uniref:UPF0434 protein Mmar10_2939-like n=1 Tax=Ostrea edulis TaxID=37623 RepID=UPI0020955B52|nr:UPF0434 protein Mmar10_2939-like [Ostrea edulis]
MICRRALYVIGQGKFLFTQPTLQRFSTSGRVANSFDESILKILVCPVSRKPLRYDREKNELICDGSGIAYPIVGGIPNLVPQDARIIKDELKDNVKSPKTQN